MVNQILEWISTVPEAESPILWPLDAKNWLTGKDPDAGKDWRQEEETTENEMAGSLQMVTAAMKLKDS